MKIKISANLLLFFFFYTLLFDIQNSLSDVSEMS